MSTAGLMAWEWEPFSTEGAPEISWDGDFHVAFNPVLNHFLFTIESETLHTVETWKLERRKWTLLTSNSSQYTDLYYGDMFYDPTLQTMLDFRWVGSADTLVYKWNDETVEWELFETLPGPVDVIAYDSDRGVYVLPGTICPVRDQYRYCTLEWDTSMVTISENTVISDHNGFSYDPAIQRSVMFNDYPIWQWDGVEWTEVPSPTIPMYFFISSVYSPSHEGIVIITGLHVLLFKDYSWSYLMENVFADAFHAKMVYNTDDEKVYAFSSLGTIFAYRLVNHTHSRPFGKP